MRTSRSLAILIPALVVALSGTPARAADETKPKIEWLDDYGTMLGRSQKEGRLVMIEFYTSWCLYCGKLEKDTFGDPRVVGLSKDFVCAKLDADVQKAAAARYEPEGFPTVVFATSSGDEILKVSGYRGPEPFLTIMKAVHEQGPKIAEHLGRIEKDPRDGQAQEALGTIYLDLGLGEKAAEHLDAALKLAPSTPAAEGGESDRMRIEFLLGKAAAAEKDYGKAAKIFQRLIGPNPQAARPAYLLELGRAYEAAGKDAKAKETYSKLAKLFPGSPEAEAARER